MGGHLVRLYCQKAILHTAVYFFHILRKEDIVKTVTEVEEHSIALIILKQQQFPIK